MDQAKTLREISDNNFTKVIAITSGKGGVGKTNLIANLGYQLSKKGKKVLLMDADLGLGNIDILLGLAPKFNISHVLNGEKSIHDIIIDGPLDMKIIPASSGIQEVTNLDESNKMLLLNEIQSLNENFDYFLIDTGAGISKNVTYFCIASQEIIVIATPEPTSITDAYALMKVLSTKYHEKKFNLVVNMVKSKEEALNVFKKLVMVADRFLDISINFIGYVLVDNNFTKSVRNQKLYSEMFPDSDISKCFINIAEKIDKMKIDITDKGNIQFFWEKLFNI